MTGPFVGKGGDKLAFALDHFAIDVSGLAAADLGSHVGGFVSCLLARGARRVFSVDTSYGTLDWRLRNDPRVVVRERTNALHVTLPEPVDLVTVDVGWTPQHLVLARAVRLVRAEDGRVLSLLKTQYEASDRVVRGRLEESVAREVAAAVISRLGGAGFDVAASVESPIRGGKGNVEFWLLVRPGARPGAAPPAPAAGSERP